MPVVKITFKRFTAWDTNSGRNETAHQNHTLLPADFCADFSCCRNDLLFVMHYLLDDEATEQLYIEKQKVLNYLAAAHELPDLSLGIGDEIFIQPTQSTFTGRLNDTMIFVASEKEKFLIANSSFLQHLKMLPIKSPSEPRSTKTMNCWK